MVSGLGVSSDILASSAATPSSVDDEEDIYTHNLQPLDDSPLAGLLTSPVVMGVTAFALLGLLLFGLCHHRLSYETPAEEPRRKRRGARQITYKPGATEDAENLIADDGRDGHNSSDEDI